MSADNFNYPKIAYKKILWWPRFYGGGARWRIVDQYIPEIYEKHEKYERGEREETNSKQMIPNDVI